MKAKKSVGMNYNKPFPSRLRALLEETETTQSKLAEVINIKRQTISSYSLGETLPDIETFEKIADYFGVTTDYLLGKTNNKTLEGAQIGNKLGLTDKAIKALSEYDSFVPYFTRLLINEMLECAMMDVLGFKFHQMLETAKIEEEKFALKKNGITTVFTSEEKIEFSNAISTLECVAEEQERVVAIISEEGEALRYQYREFMDLFGLTIKDRIKPSTHL